MLQDSSSNQASPNVLTNQTFEGSREAVRHIIIGSPLGVCRTIHQLHAARYAEVARWTHAIAIPDDRIIKYVLTHAEYDKDEWKNDPYF